MRLGFIGLGVMGRPMALHLLQAGHQVAVWARRSASCEPLLAAGALHCASAAAVAGYAEVVFTMVTAGTDVEHLTLSADGLLAGFAPGSILVDMSTIAPQTARSLAERLSRSGVDMLDAPVSGGEQGAIAATLAIMVGGKAAVLERVRPLFALLGRSVVHVGEHGAGQVAKVCNQMLMVAAIQAVAEALHLSRAAGADPARVRQALAGGSAGSRVLEVMGGRMVDRDFVAGVEARLHHKDYRIVIGEAYRLGIPLPVAAQVDQQLNALMAMGWGRADTASLLRVLEAGGQCS
ncbi:MAG: NAD(P)-dependent oxidoreductase [Candidatus Accumulibacter phosphatis]|uniref:2-hydroxy-3-oxopropionate reductase n=2 Tax=Candidatus Accumulibacter TaxID=327159 RepID=A0A080MEK8_9PROT|nr:MULTISPECIES: NAD(P)-dependent oxidoreductase [Candidatus Accumulibacter]KFB75614.1 MAG: 2-hydroxy-3-oxopropionate reductase [Candidatus Accumulibacter cognatus]MBL8401614.1 NAD(P)-dependent oxidoreductase [Accumulibacter sp.]MBN8518927.1 NAD(P)-dependent oxidoreductase [Accumulibacter sp.]MBO3711747.1 NAD(P)-dependent oxidoreductase [Accumulibacter sp.]MCC2868609.1 NAD(P)-dependent oxidoreductase [Candidatus Accumulibacter phosphatis]